jgi:glycosyltransferase involved in cell wall biosynthesis
MFPDQSWPPDQDWPGNGVPDNGAAGHGVPGAPTGPAYSYPPPAPYDSNEPPGSYDPGQAPGSYRSGPATSPFDSVPGVSPFDSDPLTPPLPHTSYDSSAPQASQAPQASYDPSAAQSPYDATPSYDPAATYQQAPTYELPPSYQGGPAYEGATSYDTPPGYDAPATYGTSPTYETPPGYDRPGAVVDDPAFPASPFGTAPAAVMPELEPEPEFTYQGAPDDGQAPHVSIVLPCYNEQDHVLRELERISRAMDASGVPYELIAVDDASTDATLDRLKLAEPKLPRLKIRHFPRNGGAGTVRRIGSQQAQGDIVVWTDADMTYPNERIPELVAILDADSTIDQVVGARTSEEGTHKLVRVPAKWFIRKLAEKLTNSEIPDLNSGLRAFRREVALPYLRLLPAGFSCVTTITLSFLSNEHGVKYVPIDYAKRAGVSKFRFVSDAYRYILQVLRMVMYFNPLKVLMPVALFLLGLGILKGIYDMARHPFYFAIDTVLIFLTGLIIASMALLADLIVRSRGDT